MQAPQPTYQVNGAAIREIRMSLGMSIAEAAANAGISASYLRQLELGFKRHMRPPNYTAIRTVLRTTDARILAPPEDPIEKE
ncbi:helix-turn-helix domain-containing protein [Streptomyces sp. VTCC 41912]|uniref:helix-turn-helix domain-containing protein n=1 Tax=Streptomyces TaxID=1883 RepID=UPI002F2647C2